MSKYHKRIMLYVIYELAFNENSNKFLEYINFPILFPFILILILNLNILLIILIPIFA